jgi:hypothetical protein
MKLTTLVTGMAALAVLAGALALFQQQKRLVALEAKAAKVQAARAAAQASQASASPMPTTSAGLSEADKLELFRLRAEVTRLRARRTELAPVRTENQALREQIRKQAPPPGYVRMRDVQFVGQATPQAAFQSFIWAIGKGDTNALCQILSQDQADHLMYNLQQHGRDEMLTAGRIIPGYRIVDVSHRSDTEVGLKVELLPGQEAQEMTLILEGGRWRLEP